MDGNEICMAFGHMFVFHKQLQFWYNLEGRAVQVHQGLDEYGDHYDPHKWCVVVPDSREFAEVLGADAEGRAFSMAVKYIDGGT